MVLKKISIKTTSFDLGPFHVDSSGAGTYVYNDVRTNFQEPKATYNGKPIIVEGDTKFAHCADAVAQAITQSFMTINGKKVCVEGDTVLHPHPVTRGLDSGDNSSASIKV